MAIQFDFLLDHTRSHDCATPCHQRQSMVVDCELYIFPTIGVFGAPIGEGGLRVVGQVISYLWLLCNVVHMYSTWWVDNKWEPLIFQEF